MSTPGNVTSRLACFLLFCFQEILSSQFYLRTWSQSCFLAEKQSCYGKCGAIEEMNKYRTVYISLSGRSTARSAQNMRSVKKKKT